MGETIGKTINWVVVVIAAATMVSSLIFVNQYKPQPTTIKEVVVKDMQQDMKIVMVFQDTEQKVKDEIHKEYPNYIIFDLQKTPKYYIVTLAKEADLNGSGN